MLLAEHLVQGADVWLNTPRRPWEACGTSSMKVLVNGSINLSELDGWWAEAHTPEVGWALGDQGEHGDDPAWDAAEANALYGVLENQVVPEFYNRNENGIPECWVEKMRKSMATLTSQFSANRTVREYTEKYYLPAAINYLRRTEENGAARARIVNSYNDLRNNWNIIKFGQVRTEAIDNGHLFHVQVWMNRRNSDQILIELYAEGINGELPVRISMLKDSNIGNDGAYEYHAQVTGARLVSDYTPHIIANYEDIVVPLEDNHILWQH
jgi:glycogen phosphorylase